ncbi:MAG: hypothetical protein Q7S72_01030 [Candidatus Taylorbacteria bacterium]|nr:hypothetical protein [Candidatus Taylorbacteria bacterium]
MDAKDLPNCCSRTREWLTTGGVFGANLIQQTFKCGDCGRQAIFLSPGINNVLLVATEEGGELPIVLSDWCNTALLPTWRDSEERLNVARKIIDTRWWEYACDEVGVPYGTQTKDVPEDRRQQWMDFWDLRLKYQPYMTPAGFEKRVIPPQLPEGLFAYLFIKEQDKAKLVKVDHKESMAQSVPPDPIRVNHDIFFREVFDSLRKSIPCEFIPEQVRNEYCGAENQPWFRFTIGKNLITVGTRKRVFAIKVASPDGFNTGQIRNHPNVQGGEKTTYVVNDNWQGKDLIAKKLEVHAWTKEQLTQFLEILSKESLNT